MDAVERGSEKELDDNKKELIVYRIDSRFRIFINNIIQQSTYAQLTIDNGKGNIVP